MVLSYVTGGVKRGNRAVVVANANTAATVTDATVDTAFTVGFVD